MWATLIRTVPDERKAVSLPRPADLVRRPPVDAWVERMDDNRFHLRWTLDAERVTLFAGPRPEAVARDVPRAEVRGAQELILDDAPLADAVRPTFALRFHGGPHDGAERVVAERFVPLERGVNFRDAGGYPTRDGRYVRWGQVYRSGLLSQLSARDVETLSRLGVRLVCDLRSAPEAAAHPDRLPLNPGPTYRHLPMVTATSRWRQIWQLFRKRNRLDRLLLLGYTRVAIDENAALIGQVLRRMAAAEERPLLIHCTAGKDRTGVVVALLLALLGVEDNIIIADYTLSNLHFDGYAPTLAKDVRRLTRLGFSRAQIQPILVADARVMADTLAYVRDKYGSVEAYARDAAGLDATTLARLRAELLSEMRS